MKEVAENRKFQDCFWLLRLWIPWRRGFAVVLAQKKRKKVLFWSECMAAIKYSREGCV